MLWENNPFQGGDMCLSEVNLLLPTWSGLCPITVWPEVYYSSNTMTAFFCRSLFTAGKEHWIQAHSDMSFQMGPSLSVYSQNYLHTCIHCSVPKLCYTCFVLAYFSKLILFLHLVSNLNEACLTVTSRNI